MALQCNVTIRGNHLHKNWNYNWDGINNWVVTRKVLKSIVKNADAKYCGREREKVLKTGSGIHKYFHIVWFIWLKMQKKWTCKLWGEFEMINESVHVLIKWKIILFRFDGLFKENIANFLTYEIDNILRINYKLENIRHHFMNLLMNVSLSGIMIGNQMGSVL